MSVIGGRYRVEDQLGAGGMGTVFRALDEQTGETVALKVLKRDVQSTVPDAVERFSREAEALRRLNHPNIVKVLDNFEDGSQHIIVMEYVDGGTLYDLIHQRGRLSVSRTLELALDLADALTRAHRLKIVHRDLKPANVLIAADGTPRLTDFGVAHMGTRERVTQTGTAIGTLDYMSPEGLNSLPVDERADIWSFGVILFEMLTGQRPFVGDHLTGVITAILTHPTPDLETLRPDAPLGLVDLIYRMLTKDREARLPSVRVIGAELEALLRGTDLATPSSALRLQRSGADTQAFERFNAPVTPSSKPLHNLPAHTTPFVGRESELAEISRLLAKPDVRLVTILGTGGMGKTRLALQAAEEKLGQYQHGVYFVPLAPLRTLDTILTAVAAALGYTFNADGRTPEQQLLDFLREKHLLLIMDNFEHVLDAASLVNDILLAAPDVTVIATSRERLNLSAETIYTLSGMDFPAWETPEDAMQYSAVQLFNQGARRAQPSFEQTPEILPFVARICRLVDGVPLAILLAAAWVETLTPHEIADELAQNYDLLESDQRDLPERHRSIRAVFEYSWNLLTEAERETFARLSIFHGGFEREAARRVTGASLKTLTSLFNKSLVRRDPETGRFTIHMLLHQYASEVFTQKYAGDGALQHLHAQYYLELLQNLEVSLNIQGSKTAVETIDAELENIRCAWGWAVEHREWSMLDSALEPLTLFYYAHSMYQEGISRFGQLADYLKASGQPEDDFYWRLRARQARLLEQIGIYDEAWRLAQGANAYFLPRENNLELLRLLNSLSYIRMMQGSYDEAKAYALKAIGCGERCVPSGTPDRSLLNAKANLGYVEFLQGNYDEAQRIYESLLAITQIAGPNPNRAFGLNNLGEILFAKGEIETATALFQEAYAIFKNFRSRRGMAFTLNNLAGTHTYKGEYDRALAAFREAHDLYREIGDRKGIAHSLSALGNAAAFSSNFAEAHSLYEQALTIRREIGDRRGQADSFSDLGDCALMMENWEEAERYFRDSLTIRREIGDQAGIVETLVWLSVVLSLRQERYDNALVVLEEANQIADHLNSALHKALIAVSYGEAYFTLENYAESRAQFTQALTFGYDLSLRGILVFALLGFARHYAISNDVEERVYALELVSLIRAMPKTILNFYIEKHSKQLETQLTELLPAETVQIAQESGKTRDIMQVAGELLEQRARV